MYKNRLLGTMSWSHAGLIEIFSVISWGSYGVVCPGKMTTNGSAAHVAERLCEIWDEATCTWESAHGVLGPEAGKEAFRSALVKACNAHTMEE
jgi:hypothetical protein